MRTRLAPIVLLTLILLLGSSSRAAAECPVGVTPEGPTCAQVTFYVLGDPPPYVRACV